MSSVRTWLRADDVFVVSSECTLEIGRTSDVTSRHEILIHYQCIENSVKQRDGRRFCNCRYHLQLPISFATADFLSSTADFFSPQIRSTADFLSSTADFFSPKIRSTADFLSSTADFQNLKMSSTADFLGSTADF